MVSFTFDTNCLIDLDAGRPSAVHIQKIIDAHRSNEADAAFVAVSASERQKDHCYLENYRQFTDLLRQLEVDDIPQIHALAYFGLGFYGHGLWSSPELVSRAKEIHDVLFSTIPFSLCDFGESIGVPDLSSRDPRAKRWRNAWCDRQMLWAHDHHQRDVFVTSDRNFSKIVGRNGFEHLQVCSPEEAATVLT